jgi:hypothetical protein
MPTPEEIDEIHKKYADASTAPGNRVPLRCRHKDPVPPDELVTAVERYKEWRQTALALKSAAPVGCKVRIAASLTEARKELETLLKRHRYAYKDKDGTRYAWCNVEGSIVIRPPVVHSQAMLRRWSQFRKKGGGNKSC